MNKFASQYVTLFGKASGGYVPKPKAIALKGLEEYIELLFAIGGVKPDEIQLVVHQAVQKEVERATPPSRQAVLAEVADVNICVRTFTGLFGLDDTEVEAAADAKHKINGDRRWRVNGFGSLSHVKD